MKLADSDVQGFGWWLKQMDLVDIGVVISIFYDLMQLHKLCPNLGCFDIATIKFIATKSYRYFDFAIGENMNAPLGKNHVGMDDYVDYVY